MSEVSSQCHQTLQKFPSCVSVDNVERSTAQYLQGTMYRPSSPYALKIFGGHDSPDEFVGIILNADGKGLVLSKTLVVVEYHVCLQQKVWDFVSSCP